MKKSRQLCGLLLAGAILTTSLAPVTVNAAAWKKDSAGWWYQEDNGSWPANQWKMIGGQWYWFQSNGYMATGWKYISGNWYYFQPSGAMLGQGWHEISGEWYYMYSSGAMATDAWIEGNYVNSDGVRVGEYNDELVELGNYLKDFYLMYNEIGGKPSEETGDHENWILKGEDRGRDLQYGNYRGSMSVDDVSLDSDLYSIYGIYVGQRKDVAEEVLAKSGWNLEEVKSGLMIEVKKGRMNLGVYYEGRYVTSISFWREHITYEAGMYKDTVGWWYREENGNYAANQWKMIGGQWYWFQSNGYMATGWKYISGNWYYFQTNGAMLGEGWHVINGNWYYMYSNGAMAADIWIGDSYVNGSGVWESGKVKGQVGWIKSGNRWWYRHDDGSYTKNGWEKIDGSWYLFDSYGWMLTGWQYVSGNWYYMQASGAMLEEGWHEINGRWYYMYSDGTMASDTWIDGYYVGASGVLDVGEDGAKRIARDKFGSDYYYFCNQSFVYQGQKYYVVYVKVRVEWHYTSITQALVASDGSSAREGFYCEGREPEFFE